MWTLTPGNYWTLIDTVTGSFALEFEGLRLITGGAAKAFRQETGKQGLFTLLFGVQIL